MSHLYSKPIKSLGTTLAHFKNWWALNTDSTPLKIWSPLDTDSSGGEQVYVASRAFILYNDKILLLERTKGRFAGYWEPPGGGFNEDQDMTVCNMFEREVEEETGIKGLKLPDEVWMHILPREQRIPIGKICATFNIQEDINEVELSEEEHRNWMWATIDDISTLLMREEDKGDCERILSRKPCVL